MCFENKSKSKRSEQHKNWKLRYLAMDCIQFIILHNSCVMCKTEKKLINKLKPVEICGF